MIESIRTNIFPAFKTTAYACFVTAGAHLLDLEDLPYTSVASIAAIFETTISENKAIAMVCLLLPTPLIALFLGELEWGMLSASALVGSLSAFQSREVLNEATETPFICGMSCAFIADMGLWLGRVQSVYWRAILPLYTCVAGAVATRSGI